MTTSVSDAVAQAERALLGSILLDNSVLQRTEMPTVEDFSLDSHKRIYRQMLAMAQDGRPIDLVTLTFELSDLNLLESCGGPGYVASLVEVVVPENAPAYARHIREAAQERRYSHLLETLSQSTKADDRLAKLEQMAELLKGDGTSQDWRALFHTRADIENAPPLSFAIDGFLQEEGITLIGGLAGHGKTLCMLAMVRALLEQGRLFTKFQATRLAKRVLYLIPEAGIGPFSSRLRTFRLMDYLDDRLFVQTLSAKTPLTLTDSRLLKAAEGADVFLDTAVRFMQGDENNASEQRAFAESLFRLQAAGARTITGAHHSPKSFSKDTVLTLENVLRGSGDIGAMLCTAWGLKQVDPASNSIYIANVKPRDFQPCEPFIICGRPSLDQTGYFEMSHPPGFAGSLGDHVASVGRPALPEKDGKQAEARKLRDQGMSYRHISDELDVKVPTLHRWLKESL